MSVIQERYSPLVVGVNATVPIYSSSIGGFLAITAGTITVTALRSTGSVTIVNALPVAAGVYYPMPFKLSENGGSIVAAGGASGTAAVH